MTAPLRALTIWRPWAGLIAAGVKPIENRDWPPPKSLVGEYLAIHAGKKWDGDGATWAWALMDRLGLHVPAARANAEGIVAVARVTGAVTTSDSPWFVGDYGWTLAEVVAIDPVPCKGMQGLWTVPPDVLATVRARYAAAKGGAT